MISLLRLDNMEEIPAIFKFWLQQLKLTAYLLKCKYIRDEFYFSGVHEKMEAMVHVNFEMNSWRSLGN